jgi:hypothetical protein
MARKLAPKPSCTRRDYLFLYGRYGVPVGWVAGVSVLGCSAGASDIGWSDIEESADFAAGAGSALLSVVLQAPSDNAPRMVNAYIAKRKVVFMCVAFSLLGEVRSTGPDIDTDRS